MSPEPPTPILDAEPSPKGRSAPSKREGATAERLPVSVLVVEDDPVSRMYMKQSVGLIAETVFTASDGREGLFAFARQRPDVVVTDLRMPRMDGVALAKAVKAIAPETPIIFSTAFEDASMLKEAIAVGVSGYLVKPVVVELLRHALVNAAQSVLRRRELDRQKRVNEMMIKSLPYAAMLLRRGDLSIVAANASAAPFVGLAGGLVEAGILPKGLFSAEAKRHAFDLDAVGAGSLELPGVELGGSVYDLSASLLVDGLILVTAVDATSRVQAERALKSDKDFAQTIVNCFRDGLAVVSREGTVKYLSPGMEKLLGVEGRPVEHVWEWIEKNIAGEAETREAMNLFLEDGLRDNPPERVIPIRRRGRALRWIRLKTSPMPGYGDLVFSGQDITAMKRAEEKIQRMALQDPLTRLPNRRLFLDRLQQSLTRFRRTGQAFGVLYIDLDGFKEVNDERGHEAGDKVLKAVAKRLTQAVREIDTVARMGGDEFTVILPDLRDPDEAMLVADRIVESMCAPFEVKGLFARLGASVGVALCPIDGRDVDGLVTAADKAMYRAKKAGGGRRERLY